MKQVESASASASASESASASASESESESASGSPSGSPSESESEMPPLVKPVYPSTVSKCGEVERWTGVLVLAKECSDTNAFTLSNLAATTASDNGAANAITTLITI